MTGKVAEHASKKVSKETAEYTPADTYAGTKHCSKCSMWIPGGACTAVKGLIEAKATCKYWEKK